MERTSRLALATGLILLLSLVSVARAQGTRPERPSREDLHPELVDTTWGTRTGAAWKLALASQWDAARTRFTALHQERPAAVEALSGLGFVARATGRRGEARYWYAGAVAAEPSAELEKQLEAVEWDRPTVLVVSAGATRTAGTTSSDWSGSIVAPINQVMSINGRVGAIGAGDPLRGIFLDSARGGGTRATMISGGLVLHPSENSWLSGRTDRWTAAGRTENYLWIEATSRVTSRVVTRAGVRPLGGATGATQVSAAVDLIASPRDIITMEGVQGLADAPFEARSEVRLFYLATPNVRHALRVGVLREVGTHVSATTATAAETWYLQPTTGIRVELLARHGVYGRTYANVGLSLRR
ncbi:MAG: hypothetical protein JWM95_5295 [Gemmatimonadetes bacterium]|nr:hypothetical protein [Gemmatimonadota bacterium]